MSFPLQTLSQLLAPDTSVLGSVVAINGNAVRVATARGALQVHTVETLAVGDRVLIRNGMASKAPVARQIYPV